MSSCTKDGEHGASVRLCNNTGRIDSVDVTPTEHSHTGYKHWFIVKDNGQFVSLYTTPHAVLVGELKKSKRCDICVLILDLDSILSEP